MFDVSIHYPTAKALINADEPTADKVRIEFILPKRPFLFWVTHHAGECLQFPRGYGVAYYDPNRAYALFAPMPFNVLIGVAIHIYHWFRIGCAVWFWKHRPKGKTK